MDNVCVFTTTMGLNIAQRTDLYEAEATQPILVRSDQVIAVCSSNNNKKVCRKYFTKKCTVPVFWSLLLLERPEPDCKTDNDFAFPEATKSPLSFPSLFGCEVLLSCVPSFYLLLPLYYLF